MSTQGIHEFEKMYQTEREDIELHRDLPKDDFKKWLIGKRLRFTELINTLHEAINKSTVQSNLHDALQNLNYWYDMVDIYDNEIAGKREQKQKEKPEIKTLLDACLGEEQYKFIKSWFINENLCAQGNPLVWLERKKFGMTLIVNYIRDLEIKGYTRHLTQQMIEDITRNSFEFEVTVNTQKKIKPAVIKKIPPFKK